MDTTEDELRRCPICGELGEHEKTTNGPNRSRMYFFGCRNPQCRWFNGAPWVRQRRSDGSWVEAQDHKKFFKSDPQADTRIEQIQQGVDAEIRRSMGQG